jgi:hypothetical protein
MGMQLLFLDFDGVLHPVRSSKADHFCRRENFESVIREFPAVRIVITSTWRQVYTLGQIRAMFSEDVGARIIGMTAEWEDGDDHYVRFREIREFLRTRSLTGARWIALDDSGLDFPDSCTNLHVCDSEQGLDAEAAEGLRARLRSMHEAPSAKTA